MKIKRQKVNFKKNYHEYTVWDEQKYVCGVDEVGRGCLAGPVVTAAVILPQNTTYELLQDSKQLTQSKREMADKWIKKNCWFSVGITHNRLIDQHNIWRATKIAMSKAVVNLFSTCPYIPDCILVDAMPLNFADTAYKNIPIYHFSKGEEKSSSIAAASIIAKVYRDELMRIFDPIFPGYALAKHKGYCTKIHTAAIKSSNRTIIHRISFLKNIISVQESQENKDEAQQSFC